MAVLRPLLAFFGHLHYAKLLQNRDFEVMNVSKSNWFKRYDTNEKHEKPQITLNSSKTFCVIAIEVTHKAKSWNGIFTFVHSTFIIQAVGPDGTLINSYEYGIIQCIS